MGWHQAAELGSAGVLQQCWCPLPSLPDNDPTCSCPGCEDSIYRASYSSDHLLCCTVEGASCSTCRSLNGEPMLPQYSLFLSLLPPTTFTSGFLVSLGLAKPEEGRWT